MKRQSKTFRTKHVQNFVERALFFADTFDRFAYFNPNDYNFPYGSFKHFIAIGEVSSITFQSTDSFADLKRNLSIEPDFWIGHFTYDLKNEIEVLSSDNLDLIEFPKIGFFKPHILIEFENDEIIITATTDPESIFQKIMEVTWRAPEHTQLQFTPRLNKQAYLKTIEQLKSHIVEGDIYEINFCQEYYAEDAVIDPVATYLKLNQVSPSPFSCLYKTKDHYLLCASPERFLKKEGTKLISQPIKGTAKRGRNKKDDLGRIDRLKNSEKERAENMMIVDLVRNDLAKSCRPGSITVEEIFGVYTFPLWHQMISTITGTIKPEVHMVDAIKNAFPMGSMTGAPKIKMMQLAEHYENSLRGIYSGSIGYFLPNGDFDFNVVIRSLAYNASAGKASFMVGGAITHDSVAEEEYEECLTKAKTIFKVFDRN